jgi:CHASE2 domain-containing sensor protein
MVLLTLALAAMVLMLVIRQISEDFTVAVVFGVLSVCSMILSYLLFRTLKKSGPV